MFSVALATLLCSAVGLGSGVRLIDNGYEGLVIAINPAVPEDPKLVDAIKEMVTQASAYLHTVTNNQMYFRNVSILIPSSWKTNSSYQQLKSESYGQVRQRHSSFLATTAECTGAHPYLIILYLVLVKRHNSRGVLIRHSYHTVVSPCTQAEVLIALRDDPEDDSPYTHQYGLCGDPGQYIQLTPNFLLADKNLDAYGPRGTLHKLVLFMRQIQPASTQAGHVSEVTQDWVWCSFSVAARESRCCSRGLQRVTNDGYSRFACCFPGRAFVHEWGHLRWGLYDEYSIDIPFYFESGKVEFTRLVLIAIIWTVANDLQIPKKKIHGRSPTFDFFWQVQEFCSASSHNKAAPNPHNRLCGLKSAWEVMLGHQDFANPTVDNPMDPSFTLLRPIHRVIVLVLDVSGSMANVSRSFFSMTQIVRVPGCALTFPPQFQRIPRLRQASEIFIMQILEDETMAGIVTFDHQPNVNKGLTRITDDTSRKDFVKYLPRASDRGGTEICKGVRQGLLVLSEDNGDAYGDEIILLTDGEDKGISLCFQEAFDSGCTIHTIALGPGADAGLETLSTITGEHCYTSCKCGLHFYATDNLDTNGLVDAFTSTTTDTGDSHSLVVQVKPTREVYQALESTGETMSSNECLEGVVYMDTSVGNNTKYVVTWLSNKVPEILVSDPGANNYTNLNFTIDEDFKTARLTIPGTSQPGVWSHSICNRAADEDTFALMVTSSASRQGVKPITMEAHVLSGVGGQPQINAIYAQIMQGFTPVVGATVFAFIERPSEPVAYKLELLDNGAGADVNKDDGVYSRFFTQFTETGRYSVKVKVTGERTTARLAPQRHSRASFIPGFRNEKGELEVTQVPAPAGGQVLVPSEDFSRVASGGSFQATVPPGGPPDIYPPCRVLDLTAELLAPGIVSLAWTAPGDDADFGQGAPATQPHTHGAYSFYRPQRQRSPRIAFNRLLRQVLSASSTSEGRHDAQGH
ncbi:calcium-activated chloride channel regulator 1-like [Petromyzon marinus]|uniref:calcium-activated chloride channel regulator 1-like n=1 Tax=Petromyzon marinus TaxID=7757 RepID=UPI003F6EF4F4